MYLKMLLSTIFALIAFQSCNDKNADEDRVVTAKQYVASKNRDTAKLYLELRGQHFSGAMELTYKGTSRDSGTVKGDIKGDTLFGDFHFQRNGFTEWRRTPIALLKKGDQLIMGQSAQVNTFGIQHLSYPIDFDEHERYVFSIANLED